MDSSILKTRRYDCKGKGSWCNNPPRYYDITTLNHVNFNF